MAKMSKLNLDELDLMSIGMALDHIELYSDLVNPERDKNGEVVKVRKASQADINAFKI